jgi:hypothetical protein
MPVPVDVIRTVEFYQSAGLIIYFWELRDSRNYWGYNALPSPFDHPFQQIEIERITFSRESNGVEKANLWVRADRGGLMYLCAMKAPFNPL